MVAVGGLMGKGVPPNLPKFLLPIRIAIIVLSVIILALAAYAIAVFSNATDGIYYSSGASGLLIFVVIKTWIIYGVLTAIELRAPHLFYRFIACIGYAISIIFWLSAWAWSASLASFWLSYSDDYGFDVYDNSFDSTLKSEGGALAACAGLGAVVWVLSIVHYVIFFRACLADRTVVAHNQAELGQVQTQKQEATTTVYTTGSPAPVVYQQQPVAYQQQPVAYQQQPVAYQQPQPYTTQ